MSTVILLKLIAIFVMIAVGYVVGRLRTLGPNAADTLSAVTFTVFTPALLFLTMASVSLAALPRRMLVAEAS